VGLKVVSDPRKTRAICRGPEARGEFRGEGRKISRFVGNLDTPCLQPRKIKQRVDELQKPQTIPVRDVNEAPLLNRKVVIRLCK
jgi:hypothetical protein